MKHVITTDHDAVFQLVTLRLMEPLMEMMLELQDLARQRRKDDRGPSLAIDFDT